MKEKPSSNRCQKIFDEILKLVPDVDWIELRERRKGQLRFPVYMNEKLNETEIEALELSVRSGNCLYRAGYRTIGELVAAIDSREDLKKIRNCGTKSIDEILEQLFCFQYGLLEQGQKIRYINRILELNQ